MPPSIKQLKCDCVVHGLLLPVRSVARIRNKSSPLLRISDRWYS